MHGPADPRRWLRRLFVAVLVAGGAFVVAAIWLSAEGVVVHELGGAVLLALLGGAGVLAWRTRAEDRRPLARVTGSLVALALAGSLGAALASGRLPAGYGPLPLVPLAAMLAFAADGVRICGR